MRQTTRQSCKRYLRNLSLMMSLKKKAKRRLLRTLILNLILTILVTRILAVMSRLVLRILVKATKNQQVKLLEKKNLNQLLILKRIIESPLIFIRTPVKRKMRQSAEPTSYSDNQTIQTANLKKPVKHLRVPKVRVTLLTRKKRNYGTNQVNRQLT